MRWSISTSLLFAIISATATPAHEIDAAIAKHEKKQVSLSTGVSSLTSVLSSATSAASSRAPTTTFVVESSAVTSGGSVVIESSTVTATPTVLPSTVIVQSTITRQSTAANGQTTQVQETISSTAISQITYSFSQFVTSSASQVIQTYTETQGGSTVTGVRTSSTLVPVTTSSRVAATALAGSSGGGGSSGLSDTNKKVIGGVVGGVGGALVIGALAYTVWRIWGRKKNLHDDNLYDPNAANTEKLSTSTDNNQQQPFRSTLDQYHNPGPVNTASNF